MRLCMVYATIGVAMTALTSLFGGAMPAFYVVGLIAMGAMAWAFSQRRLFDVFVLSALGLGLNVMLVTGLARLLLERHGPDPIFGLLVIGGSAAVMLGATVRIVMRLAREHGLEEAA
jgi:hypothetical protein